MSFSTVAADRFPFDRGKEKLFLTTKRANVGRFARVPLRGGGRLRVPAPSHFQYFLGKLQMPRGYEPALTPYQPKNGNRLLFLYIFRNKKGRE
ncbi:MAG: hypothetical protein AVDCRST_MAG56-4733 [uncultured Cytophagales bacterium]|uniref:Uncharacterized protein n=1 Tax=uncultured Cytophagales bacterium TaxID=158755 RepID=A0A6J4K0W7_9SPHI|nr:MAG: hypothetical protein AVDCRST_MAG56-4733 [uncultured Cytophagales bacterium]